MRKKRSPYRYDKNPLKSPFRVSTFDQQMKDFGDLNTDVIKTGTANIAQVGKVKGQEFKNNFEDVKNPYANMNMENFAEDLTVNQGQAEFEKQQGMQQESNMLDAMRGGGGFNAGNIQAMSNAGSQRRQQASASIGQQESANQKMQVAGAQDVQRRRELQASGQGAAEMQRAQGAENAQSARAASGMQIAGMQNQNNIAQGQLEATNNQLAYTAASDARNLQFQKSQGMLQLTSGKDAADAANEEADKNWGQKTGGW